METKSLRFPAACLRQIDFSGSQHKKKSEKNVTAHKKLKTNFYIAMLLDGCIYFSSIKAKIHRGNLV